MRNSGLIARFVLLALIVLVGARAADFKLGSIVRPPQKAAPGEAAKSRLPVGLIFACLIVVYVGIRYFLQ